MTSLMTILAGQPVFFVPLIFLTFFAGGFSDISYEILTKETPLKLLSGYQYELL